MTRKYKYICKACSCKICKIVCSLALKVGAEIRLSRWQKKYPTPSVNPPQTVCTVFRSEILRVALGFFHFRNEEKTDLFIFGLKFLLKNAAIHLCPNRQQMTNSIHIYLDEKKVNAFFIQYEKIKLVGQGRDQYIDVLTFCSTGFY